MTYCSLFCATGTKWMARYAAACLMLFGTYGVAQAMPREVRIGVLQAVVGVWAVDWEDDVVVGTGSGTIISPQGHVLTNFHVIVDDDGEPLAMFPIFVSDPSAPDEAATFRFVAVLIAGDADTDIAILRIVGDAEFNEIPAEFVFPSVPLGSIDTILIGDPVFVVGFPAVSGSTVTFTSGVVSGFIGEDGASGGRSWIKTDAQIARGNSGGGAFDVSGTLVGIPTIRRSLASQAGVEVQNYLRPVDTAMPLIQKHVAAFVLADAPAPEAGQPAPTDPAPVEPSAGAPRSRAVPPTPGARVTTWVATGNLDADNETHFPGRYAHRHEIGLEAEASVRVRVVSQQFDPYLLVVDPAGNVILDVDDTAGEGTNVDEVIVSTTPGTYTIIVTSAYRQERGQYTLMVDGDLVSVPFVSVDQVRVPELPATAAGIDPSFDYSGTWEGTISDSVAGAGTIRVVMAQTGPTIVGTWQAVFPSQRTGGTVTGLVQSTGVFLEISPSDQTACPFRSVARFSGHTLSGTYVAFDCLVSVSGALTLSKQ